MEVKMTETVLSFRFLGGDAKQNQLNFYDASRFMYGAARFIYTLEHYRQTGRILGRITENIDVDFRISAPKQGSWIQDVLLASAPILADATIKVPIDIMVAWVFEKLVPSGHSRNSAARIVEAHARQEEARAQQSHEETERFRILAESNQRALDAMEQLSKNQAVQIGEFTDQITETRDELRAAVARIDALEKYRKELNEISESDERRILDRAHPQLIEIGKPLLRSAREVKINGQHIKKSFGVLNRRSIEVLGGMEVDYIPASLLGSITRYDKETGWGKFRNQEFVRPISFQVPPAKKYDLGFKIIDEMKKDETLLSFYYVRDKRGTAKHLIVNKIIDE